ncbi:MAG: sodium:proton antiporter [Neisseriaceae bacterium]
MRLMPAALSLLLLPSISYGADFNGAELSLAWGIPFACILLSVALFPIFAPNFWHHHFGKVIAAWTLAFLVPFTVIFGPGMTIGTVAHAMLGEYIPFILLLLALYTVSGGILIWGNLDGSPKLNTIILALGTFLASIMGTTGAAMLLIRPLLKANENRKHKVHVVVFFIFLVANIGGGLTPLGDPPLFLGFLKGVDFMWTVQHMLPPVLMNSAILLVLFFAIDSYFFSKKDERLAPAENAVRSPLKIMGRSNFLLLLAIIASVLMSGIWKPGIEINILGTDVGLQSIVRDVLLLAITLVSLKMTPKPIRAGNEFNWDPMLEVGKLFLGIFITIAPVIAILQAGEAGHFKELIAMVHNEQGEPLNVMYFWMSGMLSAFLDNAPTYLVFFNMASGDAVHLMGEMQTTLLAVSMGSVFMGALTYIGNAPNFMVKAIAEQRKVKMPTFFGYMLWSFGILVPLYIIQTFVFFM